MPFPWPVPAADAAGELAAAELAMTDRINTTTRRLHLSPGEWCGLPAPPKSAGIATTLEVELSSSF